MLVAKRTIITGILILIAVGAAACASTGAGDRDPNLISETEIESYASLDNAHQLIQELRPRWLVEPPSRSLNQQTEIVVFQNNAHLGGVDELRSIPLVSIQRIRALSSSEAGFLPGLSGVHVSRAIVVETR